MISEAGGALLTESLVYAVPVQKLVPAPVVTKECAPVAEYPTPTVVDPTRRSPDAENESGEEIQSVHDTVTANAEAEKMIEIRDPNTNFIKRFIIYTFCTCVNKK